MGKGRIQKIVGRISHDVAEKYKLYEYENQEIIQSLDFYKHVQKHIEEFDSVDSYNNTITNIDKIIQEPYFVYYEKQKHSLHYFYEINEWCCVIVKLKLKKNKEHYVSTAYPVSKNKIDKYKEKSYIIE